MKCVKSAEKKEVTITYDVEVLRARELKEGFVVFDAKVNGIIIYGMKYSEGTSKKGEEYTMISFPNQKGKDDNYYNHVFFPISNELKESIIAMLQKKLSE